MSNIVQFYPEQVPQVLIDQELGELVSVRSSAGFEVNRNAAGSWLEQVSSQAIDRATFDDLELLASAYGFSDNRSEEEYETWLSHELSEDPANSARHLESLYIDNVIASRELSLFQKAELLSLAARSISFGKVPADGARIVQRRLQGINDRVQSGVSKRKGGLAELPWGVAREVEHIESLTQLMSEWLTPMRKTEFMRHAASVISGEEVTNLLKAYGTVFALLDQPSQREIEIGERIRSPFVKALTVGKDRALGKLAIRAKHKRSRNLSKLVDSNARYNRLKVKLPIADEEENDPINNMLAVLDQEDEYPTF